MITGRLRLRRLPLPGALLGILASAAAAQERPLSAIEGQVLDSLTREPVAEVLVRLDSGPETLSDEGGRFRIAGLPPGEHVLALLTADCRVAWARVELRAGETGAVEVLLASAFGSEAERRRSEGERRRSAGTLVTAAEIRAMHARDLEDVIRRVAPGIFGRTRNSFVGAGSLVVVVDGVRVADGPRTLGFIRPLDVGTLELLPGAAAGWEYGSDGSGGVIRITTLKGGGEVEAPAGPACSVPDFPRR